MERTVLSRQQRRALERKRKSKGAALTLGVGVAFAAAQPAAAATFNVTNLNDNGAGSLRQAIADANGAAGADVVTFQAGLTGTILLSTGQLAVTDSVDIQGPGAAAITVNGNNASRVFYLYNGSALLDVTISGLTITGGDDLAGAGVIDFGENLTLDGVTITGNTASVGGGGVWADGTAMSLTIRSSEISGNSAACCGAGGGIYLGDPGSVLIEDSVISGNDAGAVGGGIFLYAPTGPVTIENSTISGNSAGGAGGGIYLYDTDGGSLTIRTTTISGNDANTGGGLFLYGPDDLVLIENCTISGNQATGVEGGYGGGAFFYNHYQTVLLRHTTVAGNSAVGAGGGLVSQTGTLNLDNSIVADNNAPLNPDLDGAGSFDATFTLIENPGSATVNNNGGAVFNQDPQLGPLANNGGTTETHLPAFTSPVVNAGDPGFAPPPSTDQRGSARVAGGVTDMGAVELNPGTIQLTASAVSVAENVGTVTVTATRTGGTDGAVAVSFATSNGSAVQPADYALAAGALNWAHLDGAPKSFQVTIVDDPDSEPDEVFSAAISNPQGGAALGAPAAQAVTILADPADAQTLDIPTLGDYGKLLFAALCGLGGLLLLRRKKGAAAALLVISLLAADPAHAKDKTARERRAAVVVSIDTQGTTATIRLADGSRLVVAREDLQIKPEPQKKAARRKAAAEGRPAVLKVKRDAAGKVTQVKIEFHDSLAAAKAAIRNQRRSTSD